MTELLSNHVFGCWELPQTWNPIDNRLYVTDEITKSAYFISEVNETSEGNLLNYLKTFSTSLLEKSEKWNISQCLAECSDIMLVKGLNCSKTNSPTALSLLGWKRTSWVLNVLMDNTHGILWGSWTEKILRHKSVINNKIPFSLFLIPAFLFPRYIIMQCDWSCEITLSSP